ncbi:MAG: 30S ribosome-binding factor RbfA [Candidatus Tectomicrobia bacterium]|nr:30S ribosome-binding factor RbfA [Candidatus Tectomicrobia bacterium]
MHSRMERVNELLVSEIARILLREVKDPRIGFASLTHVETSKDLRHARVQVSVLGSEEQKEQTLRGLNSAAGFIRGVLAKELRLRNIPVLQFVLDDSIERAAHLTHVLHELHGEAASQSDSPDTPPDDETVDEDAEATD